VSSQTCGGNWQQAVASRLTVNPSTGFTLRFHHRDHLGSSAVSRAYSPGFDEVVAGTESFYLKVANGKMTLYAKLAKATLFDPYGEALGSVAGEPNPRYTDHEYDEASGLNYMKGRFQLANYAKFNRPDPMRDWDWENPHSINLYEYVRNNPVMANDPTGLFGDPATDSYIAVELVKNGGRAFSVIEGGAGASATGVGAVPAVVGGTIAWIAGWEIGSYLNEKTGASEYWADKLFTLVNGEPQEWLPQVYDDGEFEVEGLTPSSGGDGSDSNKIVEKAVAPGDEGTYGELISRKKKHGETEPLDMDHQPSFAAQVKAAENELGRELTPVEIKKLKANTPAVASPRKIHQKTSPTFGGRNTKAQIEKDAEDLKAAAARDKAALENALKKRKK